MERSNFHAYLAINPNFFGSLPDVGFPVELAKEGDTDFEELDCVSYSPERSRLEATFDIKRSFGYSGGLCSTGSFEHVRFFVSYDEGVDWTDVGLASVNVHDIAAGTVCDKTPYPPLSYTVGIGFSPRRNWCGIPVLPLVRAILSWEIVPDPTKPNQPPIWGSIHDCHIQIPPRRFVVDDVLSQLTADVKLNLPPYVLQQPVVPVPPIPDPGPIAPLALPELAKLYSGKAKDAVPAHRFALPHLESAQTGGAKTLESYVYSAQFAISSKIDLSAVLKQLEQLNGDTTYEQLECLGLDNNTDQLVGTFRVKRPSGFSGGPCTAGSTEYVAYWADFGDDCTYMDLGTATVTTHDYAKLPGSNFASSRRAAVRRPRCVPQAVRHARHRPGPCRAVVGNSALYDGPAQGALLGQHPGRTRPGVPVVRTTGMHASPSSVAWKRPGSASGLGLTLPGATIVENGTLLPSAPSLGWSAGTVRSTRRLLVPTTGSGSATSRPPGRRPTWATPSASWTSTASGARRHSRWLRPGCCVHALARRGRRTPQECSGSSHRAVTTSGRSRSRCSGSASSMSSESRWTTRSTTSSPSRTWTTQPTCTSTPWVPAGCREAR